MKQCRWLEPTLVAQIQFTEWTPNGHLRHASFMRLRDDKDAREVVRETPQQRERLAAAQSRASARLPRRRA